MPTASSVTLTGSLLTSTITATLEFDTYPSDAEEYYIELCSVMAESAYQSEDYRYYPAQKKIVAVFPFEGCHSAEGFNAFGAAVAYGIEGGFGDVIARTCVF